MPSTNSDLASTPLDFVVAVSQQSVNSTFFEYIAQGNFPVISMCWEQESDGGALTPITLANLMAGNAAQGGTNGTNPFNVPTWQSGSPMSQDLTNIENSNFACGIQMKIGIPPAMNIPGSPNQQYQNTLPYMLTIDSNNTNTANFSLLFAEFTVVYPIFGRKGLDAYANDSQPNGSSWNLSVSVPLSSLTVPPSGAPQNVVNALNNLGSNVFSIQQLFLDFTNAILTNTPSLQSWPAVVTNMFTVEMIQNLITQSEASQALSVVGYSITSGQPQSTFAVGNLEMTFQQYNPSTAQNSAYNTLNYLCTVPGGNTIPQNFSGISWNWFDNPGADNYDGVVAISRNTLAHWIYTQMQNNNLIGPNCYIPTVRVSMDGLDVDYSWGVTPGGTPTVTFPPTGAEVLNISFSGSASDDAGLDGDMGAMTLSPSYNATAQFSGNTIVVTQHLVFYTDIRVMQTSAGGNVVDITITDTYTLAVDQQGQLSVSLQSSTSNTSQNPSVNGFLNFFTDLNTLEDDVASWAQNLAQTRFTDMPVSFMNSFVFPGAQTFTFSQTGFSNNQDLVSSIVYNNPN
jgi:hypothetical protein